MYLNENFTSVLTTGFTISKILIATLLLIRTSITEEEILKTFPDGKRVARGAFPLKLNLCQILQLGRSDCKRYK